MRWFLICLIAVLECSVTALPQVLIYTRTAGYRHDSIPVALDALATMAVNVFTPVYSEAATFAPAELSAFSAIVFLSNSDDVLDAPGRVELERYLAADGRLVLLHSGTACLFDDTAFGAAIGSFFSYHPPLQSATFVKVSDHITVNMLPARYSVAEEEVYHFRTPPVDVTVLLSVDQSTYTDPLNTTQGFYSSELPIAWYRDTPVDLGDGSVARGSMWMTSLGHTNDTWRSSLHLAHVQAGIKWVLEDSVTTTSVSSTSTTSSSSSFSSSSSSSAIPISSFSSTMASTTPASPASTASIYASTASTVTSNASAPSTTVVKSSAGSIISETAIARLFLLVVFIFCA